MRTAAAAFALFVSLSPVAALGADFNADGSIDSNTGYVSVEWQADGPVTLEIARDEGFSDAKPLYRGEFHSYFLSGLANGRYHLRLTDEAGTRSEPLTIEVVHQSLVQAIWLMIAGALVTIGIVATIWRGARDE